MVLLRSRLFYKASTYRTETAELSYQLVKWQKEYRFIVMRRTTPKEPSGQLNLFFLAKYIYQVIFTSLRLIPLSVWKFYNARATVELIIKELKEDYSLAKIPTKHFAANEEHFHLLLFAYNLINWL